MWSVAGVSLGETAAVVAAAGAAIVAFQQLRASWSVARAQFLLDLDQAFDPDEPIRIRLAQAAQPPLTVDEWRAVKRYMARFERVSVFVAEGLLDAEVVLRLYGSRMKNIVRHEQIRRRLLENEAKARHWTDFIELWRALDALALERTGKPLVEGVTPKPAPWPAASTEKPQTASEEFDDEAAA